ncbi:hypothetical protein [Actinomadura sp. 9N215]|uniref:hypothetical protein n=1 Tax=Actinomadura sp. 9N215 TaxID=3375150 RepID=UPI003798B0F4
MKALDEADTPGLSDLRTLTPEALAVEAEAARIVARLTRTDELNADGSEAVRVAAFNSFI